MTAACFIRSNIENAFCQRRVTLYILYSSQQTSQQQTNNQTEQRTKQRTTIINATNNERIKETQTKSKQEGSTQFKLKRKKNIHIHCALHIPYRSMLMYA